MGREIETGEMEMSLTQEQSQEQEAQPYEAMVSRIIETGYRERSLEELEEAQVGGDLFRDLTWQEQQPLEKRLGNVRGMMKHLRSRPGKFHRAEIGLLRALKQVEELGEALLAARDGETVAEEIAWAEERCRFEDLLFAVTEEFFELVDELDEPWPV